MQDTPRRHQISLFSGVIIHVELTIKFLENFMMIFTGLRVCAPPF